MKIILIVKEDIKLFPPVQTIMNVLRNLGHTVIVIGHYSDIHQKRVYESRGIQFLDTGFYDVYGSLPSKLKGNIIFRQKTVKLIESLDLKDKDYYLWIFQSKTIGLLHKLIARHPCILHPLEFTGNKLSLFYKMLSPSYNGEKTYQQAVKVVCCEYNRAHIVRGMYSLSRTPFILPNKMDNKINPEEGVPAEVVALLEETIKQIKGRKVVLYQGIFLKGERRLDEFCKAVEAIGNDVCMLIMGSDKEEGYRLLKEKYKSDNILFVPFVNSPHHLLFTRLADIGILTYFTRSNKIEDVINPLFCAPNKVFEYSRFGIPMIGNDIPGLHYIFDPFHCGVTVSYPFSVDGIIEAVKKIFSDYEGYSKGALEYYNSVDVEEIIRKIVE